jgi:hypothetical protein
MFNITRIKRLLARAGGGAKSSIRWLKSHLLATASRKAGDSLTGSDPSGDAVQNLQAIKERRKLLEVQIEAAARQGLVPDGLAECLLNSFYDELEVRRQMLIELQHGLQLVMGRLEAMAPVPKPEPAPDPAPPRPRRFVSFRDWLNGTPGLAK